MRILRICLRVPYPLNEGASIEAFNTTRLLALCGHEITMVAFESAEKGAGDALPLRQYCDLHVIPFRGRNSLLNLARGVIDRSPVNYIKYRDRGMLNRCLDLIKSQCFDVVVIDHTIMGWYAHQIRQHSSVPIVVRFHDAHTLIWERWVQSQRNPIKRALGWQQYKLVRRYEREIAMSSDLCLMIGARDAEIMQGLAPGANMQFVPAGIDVGHYRSSTSEPEPGSILYLASHYRWHPNWDAVNWLYHEIMPFVWERVPSAKLYITGKHTLPEMQAWTTDGRVVLTGFVPDERTVIANSSVVAIPMRLGAGIKLKLLTALSSAKAVVSTTTGAEGVPEIRNGEHLLIADSSAGFAEAVVNLLTDSSLRRKVERNGRLLVSQHYDWNLIGSMWEAALANVANQASSACAAKAMGGSI